MNQPQSTDEFLIGIFAKVSATALGIACGLLGGAGIFAATAILLLKGGSRVGPNLLLLPGYSVTWPGSLIGAGYGFLAGFIGGWTVAFLVSVRSWPLRCLSRFVLLPSFGYSLFFIFYTYPWVRHFSDSFFSDAGDGLQNA